MAEATEKAAAVRGMFSAIAPRYDLLNHLLSLNRDRAWRRGAADRLLESGPSGGLYLDACAGTLDLSVEIAARPGFSGRVLACDFSLPMLQQGAAKASGLRIRRVCADALCLPLASGSCDGVIVGFGVRNLAALEEGLRELARVLKPGAPLVILEFTTPARQPVRALYLLYFRRVLPLVGRLISRHRSAYAYLPASVLEFPSPDTLARLLENAGFEAVAWTPYSAGIVTVHRARRRQLDP